MQRVLTSDCDPSDHLAIDEALLMTDGESLRVWEFATPVVIAGRATRVKEEIDHRRCQSDGVDILRRCSGGAAVVGGPGCLMYSIVIDTVTVPSLRRIDLAHDFVMSRVLSAVQSQVPTARWQGVCDLTWNNRKFSGNSLRMTRQNLLYHGTILYDFDLALIDRYLKLAPRQPDYRAGRDHHEFVTNVPLDPVIFDQDLIRRFAVDGQRKLDASDESIRQLRRTRYDNPEWSFRH